MRRREGEKREGKGEKEKERKRREGEKGEGRGREEKGKERRERGRESRREEGGI